MPIITKPSKPPLWATNPGVIVEPSDPKKQSGWVAEKPAFQHMNWIHNTNYLWQQYFDSYFETIGNVMTFDDGNNRIGIGTTSPSAKLHVASGDIALDNQQKLIINQGAGSNNYIQSPEEDTSRLGIFTAGSERVTINYTNGFVGIGTTSPSQKLDVHGNLCVDGGNMLLVQNIAGSENISLRYNTGIPQLFSSDPIDIYTQSNFAMRIDGNQRVGIGTTSPNSRLSVEQSMSGTGELATLTTSGSSANQFIRALKINAQYAGTSSELYGLDIDLDKTDTGVRNIYGINIDAKQYRLSGAALADYYGIRSVVSANAATSTATNLRYYGGYFEGNSGASGEGSTIYGSYNKAIAPSSATAIGGYFTASGGLNNYGLIVGSGSALVGTTTSSPSVKLHVKGSGVDYSLFEGNSSQSSNQGALKISTPKNTVSMFLGQGIDTSSLGQDECSGNIRFDGAVIAWGDLGYYPTGGGDNEYGHFRFSLTGSIVSPIPSGKVGVGNLYCGGEIGINTTNPAEKLHINDGNVRLSTSSGGIGGSAEVFHYWESQSRKSATIRLGVQGSSGSVINFLTNQSGNNTLFERMQINQYGQVGIGMTTYLSHSSKLHVFRDFVIGGENGANMYSRIHQNSSTLDLEIIANDLPANVGSLGILFKAATLGGGGPNDLVYFKNDGTVGIGTKSPQAKFHVASGDISLDNQQKLILNQGAGTNNFIQSPESNTSRLGIFTAGVERISVNYSNGYVGIGRTNPSYLLDLQSSNPRMVIRQSASNSGSSWLMFGDNSNSDNGTIYLDHATNDMSFSTQGGNVKMRLRNSGRIELLHSSSEEVRLHSSTSNGKMRMYSDQVSGSVSGQWYPLFPSSLGSLSSRVSGIVFAGLSTDGSSQTFAFSYSGKGIWWSVNELTTATGSGGPIEIRQDGVATQSLQIRQTSGASDTLVWSVIFGAMS